MGFDYTTLITNRTATDVQSAKNLTQKVKDGKTLSPQEKELFDKGLKGCYNASIDLNRVELACQDLSNRLNKYGYKVNITTKTDWNITDIPTVEQFNRIKQNIQALKDAYYILSTTPSVPEQDRNKLTYSEANDMEKIFIDLDYLIRSMIQDFIYCGVCNCGQDRIWQQRFRRY